MDKLYINAFNRSGRIYERFIDIDGVETKRVVEDFMPSLFIEAPQSKSEYQSIFDVPCIKKTYDNIKDAGDASRNSPIRLLGQDDFCMQYMSDQYEGNIDVAKFIKKVRIANIDIEVPAPEFPKPIFAKYEITSIAHWDSIDNMYTVFAVAGKSQKWSRKYSILSKELLDKVKVREFATEKEMLGRYLIFWREKTPAILTGYNTDGFDIPYIYNRFCNVFSKSIANKLSPWEIVNRRVMPSWPMGKPRSEELKADLLAKNKYEHAIDIKGVESLDWLALYKKFGYTPQASYRLDFVANSEVGEEKIHFNHNFMETYGKSEIKVTDPKTIIHTYEWYAYMKGIAQSKMMPGSLTSRASDLITLASNNYLDTDTIFNEFSKLDDYDMSQDFVDWLEDKTVRFAFQMVTDYNIKDVELVNRLDDKRGLINLAISIAYYAKINFSAVYSPIKTWDAIIFNSAKTKKLVIPHRSRNYKEDFIGGFVKDPIRGLKRKVGSFDLESLYPSIIRQCNISPETFVTQQDAGMSIEDTIEELVNGTMVYDNDRYSLSANGASYLKGREGIVPAEITKVFIERKEWKKIMFTHKQNAVAIKNELAKR